MHRSIRGFLYNEVPISDVSQIINMGGGGGGGGS